MWQADTGLAFYCFILTVISLIKIKVAVADRTLLGDQGLEAVLVEQMSVLAHGHLVDREDVLQAHLAVLVLKMQRLPAVEQGFLTSRRVSALLLEVVEHGHQLKHVFHFFLFLLDLLSGPRSIQQEDKAVEEDEQQREQHVDVSVDDHDETAVPQRVKRLRVAALLLDWFVDDAVAVDIKSKFRDHDEENKPKVYFGLHNPWVLMFLPHVNQRQLPEHLEPVNVAHSYDED